MRIAALLTVGCCLLAGAASAAAFELRLGPVPPPVVALGGDVLVRSETRGRGIELLGTSLSTGETRVLHSLQPVSAEAEVFLGGLDASPEGYAFLTFGRERGSSVSGSIAAARFGSPPRYLGTCSNALPSVQGDVVAAGQCGVSLFGLDEGTERREIRPAPATDPRLAGGLIAWREGPTIVVADVHDGTLRTRVSVGPGHWVYELDADGTVVVVREMRSRRPLERGLEQVFRAAPGATKLRRLPLAAWPHYVALVDRGVVVVKRFRRYGHGNGARGQLLAGGPRGFRHVVRTQTAVGLDVEDGRIAWSAYRGGVSSLHVEPARAN